MGLDAHVNCNCLKEGKANQHPFPEMLLFDPIDGSYLEPWASEEHYRRHDQWQETACSHKGTLAKEYLGNIALVSLVRETLQEFQERSREHFAILLEKVVYSGIHGGDHIPVGVIPALVQELREAGELRLTCAEDQELFAEFLVQMKRLCEASIATGNPIVF